MSGNLGDINLVIGFDDTKIKAALASLEGRLKGVVDLVEGKGKGKGAQSDMTKTTKDQILALSAAMTSAKSVQVDYAKGINAIKISYESLNAAAATLASNMSKVNVLSSLAAQKKPKTTPAAAMSYDSISAMPTQNLSQLTKQRLELDKYLKTLSRTGSADEIIKVNAALAENVRLQREIRTAGTSKSGIVKSLEDIAKMSKATLPALKEQRAELFKYQASLNSQTTPNYINNLARVNQQLGMNAAAQRAVTMQGMNMDRQLQKMQGTLGQFQNRLAMAFSLFAVQRFFSKLVEVRGEFELQQKALAAILQNKAAADKLWSQNVALALKSPFRLKEVVSATRQLAAYRIEQSKLYETNKMLMDISAGLGVDMDRLILAYGQVNAASVLRGQELRQFTEAGIPLVKLLADEFGKLEDRVVSTGEVFAKISTRQVPFEMVNKVFKDMTSSGGIFYNMQEIMSETLKGKLSNLKDAIDVLFNKIGEGEDGVLKYLVDALRYIVDSIDDLMPLISGLIGAMVAWKLTTTYLTLSQLAQARAAGFTSIALYQEAVATGTLTTAQLAAAKSTNILSFSFKSLWAVMAANPIGAAMAALSILVGLIPLVSGSSRTTSDIVDDVSKSVEALNRQQKVISEFKKEYYKLNADMRKNKSIIDDERTTKEQATKSTKNIIKANADLQKSILTLASTYPESTRAISDENGQLSINLKLLSEVASMKDAESRRAALANIEVTKKRIDDLKRENEALRQSIAPVQVNQRSGERRNVTSSPERISKAFAGISKNNEDIVRLSQSLELLNTVINKGKDSSADLNYTTNAINKSIMSLQGTFSKEFLTSQKLTKNIDDFGKYKKELLEDIDDIKEAMKTPLLFDPAVIREYETKLPFLRTLADIVGAVEKEKKVQDPATKRLKDKIDLYKDAKKAYDDYLSVYDKETAKAKTLADFSGRFKELGAKLNVEDLTPDGIAKIFDAALSKLSKRTTDAAKELRQELSSGIAEFNVEIKIKDIDRTTKIAEEILNKFNLSKEVVSTYGIEKSAIESLLGVKLTDAATTTKKLMDIILKLESDGGKKQVELAKKLRDDLVGVTRSRIDESMALLDKYKNFEDRIISIKDTGQKEKNVLLEQYNKLVSSAAIATKDGQSAALKLVAAMKAVDEATAKAVSSVKFDELKETDVWQKMFGDVERLSKQSLDEIISVITKYKEQNKLTLKPTELKEIEEALKRIRVASSKLGNPFSTFVTAMNTLKLAKRALQDAEKTGLPENELNKLRDNVVAAAQDTMTALKGITDMFNEVNEVVSLAGELIEAVDSNAGDLISTVTNAIMTLTQVAQSVATAVTIAAGAMNAMETASVILLIVKAVILAVMALVSILSSADKKIKRQLEESQYAVERLEYAFSRLEVAAKKAFDMDSNIASFKLFVANVEGQVRELNNQIYLEQQRGKKQDDKAIQMALDKRTEITQKLAEMRDEWIISLGGMEINSAAEDFTDAWEQAFLNAEDGVDALTTKFDDMLLNMVKKQAILRITSKLLKPIDEYIDKALADDYLSTEELDNLRVLRDTFVNKSNSWLRAFYESFGIQEGSGNDASGLQKSLASMTEDTAEVMIAYLNSMRFKLFEMSGDFADMADGMAINNSIAGQALAELQGINILLKQMRSWQDSITFTGHTVDGGKGLKAFI